MKNRKKFSMKDDVSSEDEMADFIVDDEFSPKKKKRLGTAISEALSIFGDSKKLRLDRKEALFHEGKEISLLEPSVLSEKYLTEFDDHIRHVDIPERIFLSEKDTGSHPVTEIEEETRWIYAHTTSLSVKKDDIARFLELHHVCHLEIPYIAMYHMEECSSLLDSANDVDHLNIEKKTDARWHKVLWMIQNLDRQWLLLRKKKVALRDRFTKRFGNESSWINDLTVADSETQVDDVVSKLNLHFPAGFDEIQFKRPTLRQSQYSICSKAGLRKLANRFGCSAEQLGLALSLEKLIDDLEDAEETPDEMASTFVCRMYENTPAVLQGARHMAAIEISHEPSIKKYVRGIYMENAVVSTIPTAKGNGVINSFSQFFGVKWLCEKPLSKFEDAQWLLIQKAEEMKLLQVTFKLPENYTNRLISNCSQYYLSFDVSKHAQLWNEQRKCILEEAFHTVLLPSMEKEARSLLASRAKNWLLSEYGHALWNKVSTGPYQKKKMDIISKEEAAPRVMACCSGAGKTADTFVMLDSSGGVLDVLHAESLTLCSPSVDAQQQKRSDKDRVLKFMMDHQPHVVAVGAFKLSWTESDRSFTSLKNVIYEVISEMKEKPRQVGHGMDDLSIVYVDESLARLYENSRVSGEQLPQRSAIQKRAVALGRYLQNPLAMVATLCGQSKEILGWNLHALENFLHVDEKYGMVEQVMVDITNQVGIDINLAASHQWLFSPLQFISGLGPRKAASLQKSLIRASPIFSRQDLLSCGLGTKVFENAAGFLRIRSSGLAAGMSPIVLLDDTRIHPQAYGLAKDFIKYIYFQNVGVDSIDVATEIEMAIKHVRGQPDSVRKNLLGKYLASKKPENERIYSSIMRECGCGFQDWRIPFKDPTSDEEFFMISGETKDTLAEGRLVQATVLESLEGKATCVLESGLIGILEKNDFDEGEKLSDRLKNGEVLTCKIKSIDKLKYEVSLICKESEMRNNIHQQNQNLDPYYHEDRNSFQIEKEKAPEKEKRVTLLSRMISHPCFDNITAEAAKEFLSDKNDGECLFHPSSRGLYYLTLTLKIYDGVYAHKEIVDDRKYSENIIGIHRLGKSLTIGEDTFEDLDEVMDGYVNPLVFHLKAMLNYRKFSKGKQSEVDEFLRINKNENPKRITYCFGVSHENPGTFILSYIRNARPHHEYVGLYPKGFEFRKRMFEDIDKLVAYFQSHIDDPFQETVPSIMSVADMVQMRYLVDCGYSGAGGWGGSQSEGSWNDVECGGFGDVHPSRMLPRLYASSWGDMAGPGGSDSVRFSSGWGGYGDVHPSRVPRPYGGSLGTMGGPGGSNWERFGVAWGDCRYADVHPTRVPRPCGGSWGTMGGPGGIDWERWGGGGYQGEGSWNGVDVGYMHPSRGPRPYGGSWGTMGGPWGSGYSERFG